MRPFKGRMKNGLIEPNLNRSLHLRGKMTRAFETWVVFELNYWIFLKKLTENISNYSKNNYFKTKMVPEI